MVAPGKVDCLRLLELVHQVSIADAVTLEDAARRVADVFGDVAIVFTRGAGPTDADVAVACAPNAAAAREWRALLSGTGSLIHSGLGQAFILGRPRCLAAGPWPAPGCPDVHVLLVPIRARKVVIGVIAILRVASDPPFSRTEEQAVVSVAARVGILGALREEAGQGARRRRESELLRSSLRFMAGFLESDLALEPLLVQARLALGASGLFLLLGPSPTGPLHLVAAAGPAAPPADPAVAWGLDSGGAIAGALGIGRTYYTHDTTTLDFGGGPTGEALGGERQALWAAPVLTGAGFHGVLLAAWNRSEGPSPEIRTLAGVVAELAALLCSHAQLTRESVGARAAERLSAELAAQRDAIVRQIVHDLRNAVHALGLAAEDMEYRPDDPARVRVALGTVLRQTDFMGAYLKDQLRSLEAQPLEAPPPGTLEAAFGRLEKLASRVAREGRTLRVGRMDPVQLKIPQIQLDQILERLVFEATRLANPGGTLEVWAAVADGWATIMVEDDGPGLDAAAHALLVAERRKGNGNASSIRAVEELVAAAGGQFGLRTRLGDRTSFHVGLPSAGWGGGA